MTQVKNKKVLITGGASGIGLLMGELLLERGASHLIIWDINQASLDERQQTLSSRGFRVHTYRVDVSNEAQLKAQFEALTRELGAVDILINNAGIIVGKSFKDHSFDEIERTMNINALSLMKIAHLFLPAMTKQREGHIINIASAAGMVSNPNMSVYAASKWAVIGWSDSLRLEMERDQTGVSVTTVTPYYINTGMFAGVKSPIIPILDSHYTAAKIVRAIERNQIILRLPVILYFLPLLKAIMPTRLFDLVVGKWFGVYRSMDHFKGRS